MFAVTKLTSDSDIDELIFVNMCYIISGLFKIQGVFSFTAMLWKKSYLLEKEGGI